MGGAMPAVIVIGGGFTGAAVAVALSRQAQTPLDIVVIEPRAEVGRGSPIRPQIAITASTDRPKTTS